jgi:hypothetical protein
MPTPIEDGAWIVLPPQPSSASCDEGDLGNIAPLVGYPQFADELVSGDGEPVAENRDHAQIGLAGPALDLGDGLALDCASLGACPASKARGATLRPQLLAQTPRPSSTRSLAAGRPRSKTTVRCSLATS